MWKCQVGKAIKIKVNLWVRTTDWWVETRSYVVVVTCQRWRTRNFEEVGNALEEIGRNWFSVFGVLATTWN